MSIYATIARFGIKRFGDHEIIEILAQAVPAHINYTGETWAFLPPPVSPDSKAPRAVFFVEPGDEKGTCRCAQEYVHPLLVMTGEEYEQVRFSDLIERLEAALDRKYGRRPKAIVIKPGEPQKNLY